MPFPRIRNLPCEVSNLLGENAKIPKYVYFNPSSAHPYIYIRTIEKFGNNYEMNHISIYNRKTGVMKCIKNPDHMLEPTVGYYRGIEDARIFVYKDRLWFIATSTHISKSLHSQMMIGRFDPTVSEIEFVQFLDFGAKPLKNICPFVYQDKICLIDTFTLTIYEIVCEKVKQEADKEADKEANKDIYKPVVLKKLAPCTGLPPNTMRGSTCPIHLHGNLWGCVVHEHIRRAREKQISLAYISYWMEFDIERGMVTFLSSPFIVAQWGVEFVSGIEYYKDKNEIELFLGINDEIAVVAKTKLQDLRVGQ